MYTNNYKTPTRHFIAMVDNSNPESPYTVTRVVSQIQDSLKQFGGRFAEAANFSVPDSTLGQSEYDFSYKVFPEDLATDYNGHYMIININVPVSITGDSRSAYTGTRYQTLLKDEYSKVDVLRFNKASMAGLPPEAVATPAFSLPRFTRRIKESIALYMPTGLVYNTQNKYDEVSLTALGGKLGSVGITAIGAFAREALGRGLAGSLAKGAANVLTRNGQLIGTISQVAGYPINPRVEVLYSSTDLRQFRFEVLLAPRSEKESQSIEAIIRTLRFHAAPELDPKTAGFTFVPPAEFDITFYNKGVENTKIPRINTCVLQTIEVDYAPAGFYSTFTNGHPVAARMTLGFTEVEPLHKTRVLQGF